MFKVTYSYSGKSFELSPYVTSQEKDLLLLGAMDDVNLDHALEVCGAANFSELSTDEKISMLYKFREISVGEDINLKFTCKHCGSANENSLNITNIVQSGKNTPGIIDRFKEITEDNFHEFVDINLDNMDIDEYEKLLSTAKESITKFNFIKPIICQKCSKENSVKINDPKFVIDNMSEDSLMSIYQTYNDLNFFGKYTKQDIDSMYPFERVILVSLLNKTREDFNK